MKFLPLLLLLSCGTLADGRRTLDDPQCQFYDESYLAWKAVGITASGVAAATGTGGTLANTFGDLSESASISIAVTSAVMGVLSAVSTVLSGEYADRFAERCIFVEEIQ